MGRLSVTCCPVPKGGGLSPPIRVWVQDCPLQKSLLNRPRPDQDQPGIEPLQCMHTVSGEIRGSRSGGPRFNGIGGFNLK